MLFILLINVKIPTIIGILTFMSKLISCLAEFLIILITLGSDVLLSRKVKRLLVMLQKL